MKIRSFPGGDAGDCASAPPSPLFPAHVAPVATQRWVSAQHVYPSAHGHARSSRDVGSSHATSTPARAMRIEKEERTRRIEVFMARTNERAPASGRIRQNSPLSRANEAPGATDASTRILCAVGQA